MKAVIVGLGIGSVYLEQLRIRGYEVDTVDLDESKNPTFTSLEQIQEYDLGIVATPNFWHYSNAVALATKCKVVLIEKPGLEKFEDLQNLKKLFPNTFFVVAKNNFYRANLDWFFGFLKDVWIDLESVEILWHNRNRIPYPGSWFTNKRKSWGGVHRDLMPHLINELQLLCSHISPDIRMIPGRATKKMQRKYDLESARNSGTEYGEVYQGQDAVYDVDDHAEIEFGFNGVKVLASASWKTDEQDFVGIRVHFRDQTMINFALGLCPNECYGLMVDDVMASLVNPDIKKWHEEIDQETITLLNEFVESQKMLFFFGADVDRHDGRKVGHDPAKVEFGPFQRDVSGLGLREGQNVVQKPELTFWKRKRDEGNEN